MGAIKLKSKARRYLIESHLVMLEWEPVRVGAFRQYEAGYGVRHTGTGMLTYRTGDGHHVFDCDLTLSGPDMVEVNWCQLSSGLFWTIVDWFERKGTWDGCEPEAIHGGHHPAPWVGAHAAGVR